MANPFAQRKNTQTPAQKPATAPAQQAPPPEQRAHSIPRHLIEGIEKETVYGSGRWLNPGEYLLEVVECRSFESAKERGTWFFCAEFTILEAGPQTGFQPGEQASHLIKLSHVSAKSNLKNFAMSLAPDVPENEITADVIDSLISAENPAAGIKVRCTVSQVTTRGGGDFSKHMYRPFEDVEGADDGEV